MAQFLCDELFLSTVIGGLLTIIAGVAFCYVKNDKSNIGVIVVLLILILALEACFGVFMKKIYCSIIQSATPQASVETVAPPAVEATEPPAAIAQIISPTVTFQPPTDTPTNTPTAQPKPTTQPATAVPSYPHVNKSVGSGVFSSVLTSDGERPLKQDTLNTYYPGITLLNGKPDGCGHANFGSSYIWFGGTAGTTLTINGVEKGTLSEDTGSHGVLIKISVKSSDTLCAVNVRTDMYTLNVGSSDVIAHYDSYCYRGLCK